MRRNSLDPARRRPKIASFHCNPWRRPSTACSLPTPRLDSGHVHNKKRDGRKNQGGGEAGHLDRKQSPRIIPSPRLELIKQRQAHQAHQKQQEADRQKGQILDFDKYRAKNGQERRGDRQNQTQGQKQKMIARIAEKICALHCIAPIKTIGRDRLEPLSAGPAPPRSESAQAGKIAWKRETQPQQDRFSLGLEARSTRRLPQWRQNPAIPMRRASLCKRRVIGNLRGKRPSIESDNTPAARAPLLGAAEMRLKRLANRAGLRRPKPAGSASGLPNLGACRL